MAKFWGKKLLNIKCVFWFLFHVLCVTLLILRTIQRDCIIDVCLHWKFKSKSLLLSDFNENLIFSTNVLKIWHLLESRQVGAELFHADWQKDRLGETNIRFSEFCERAWKRKSCPFVADMWIDRLPCKLGGDNYTGCSRWKYLLEVR
jgi:hypothetical protein